jgi:hypothetical protein
MISPERLDEIEARAKAAQEGPWNTEPGTYGTRITYLSRNYDYPREVQTAYLGTRDKLADSYNFWNRDAEFVAAARTDVPDLVAECRRLREALEFYADPFNWGV